MTLNTVFEQAIKEHCKTQDFLKDVKGIKVLDAEYIETVECHFNSDRNTMLTKYKVVCKMSAKKYENNRVEFQMNVYSDGSEMGVYFNRTFYEA